MTNIKLILFVFLTAVIGFTSCEETEYTLGDLTAPSGLEIATTIVGVDAENPDGNGTGEVMISTTASNVISYKIDFGDGNTEIVHSNSITHKYANPGTNEYILTVNALGTGGTTSTLSTKVKVFVAFEIPSYILDGITGTGTKTWMVDKDVHGFFGVGPSNGFFPDWWQINVGDTEKAPAYDDEVTFTKDVLNNINMTVDNGGETFVLSAAMNFYGLTGDAGGVALDTEGTKKLTFMNATSGSTADNSTQIQFVVPENGIIIWGAGATTYEIIEISDNTMFLRGVGVDGLAWYQRLIPKPVK